MTAHVTVSTDPSSFDDSGWRELLSADPQGHIFATPQWNRMWWEEFGAGKDLVVLSVVRGGALTAIVPLYRKVREGRRVLRFIGGIGLTDYLGPICSSEARGEVADALVAWLAAGELGWDEFDAHNMPVPFGFAEFLVERADAAGLRWSLEQEETAAVVALPGSWDAYLAGLGSKQRHELRRKRRRLAREHPDATLRRADPDSLEVDLKTFVELHRGAEGAKARFMRPEIEAFFERIARAFSETGWLRLELLEVGGEALAATFGFVLNGTYYLYNSAFEPEARALSPGLVLVSELVKASIEEGLGAFDLLRGPERYKYQLGAEAVPLNNVRILATGG